MSDGSERFVGSRVVLIDGRSGSGKTTLAARLAAQLGRPGRPAQILHLDLLYPGWDGLAQGSLAVAATLREGSYSPYDWHAGEFSSRRVTLDPELPLVIEGCGALTAANLAAARHWAGAPGAADLATVRAIWLECDETVRRERALARDGDTFAPHWESWAAQEVVHYAQHQPWKLPVELVETLAY